MSANLGSGPSFAAESIDQYIAVPSYFWPGPDWQRLQAAGSAVSFSVVNPNSGPGTAAVPEYVATVAAAHAAGQRVIGYVDTSYATRPLSDVLADIASHFAWYSVDGVFLDQVTDSCAQTAYYSTLRADIKARNPAALVVINPGMNTNSCYASIADVIVNFEGSRAMYEAWQPADWVQNYSPSQFWHIVYNVDPSQQQQTIAMSKARRAGNLLVTSDGLPNPFDTLPPEAEWQALIAGVRNIAPTTSTTTVPPTTTTVPATTVPVTTVPATTVPATTVPATTVPVTTVPVTTVPATTVPATTQPATTRPPTTPATTTLPSTTRPRFSSWWSFSTSTTTTLTTTTTRAPWTPPTTRPTSSTPTSPATTLAPRTTPTTAPLFPIWWSFFG